MSGRNQRTAPSPHGFTLIELLIVVAIVVILMGILFPVFARARDRARSVSCISNLKQLALAMEMYQQAYDDGYPNIRWRQPDDPENPERLGTVAWPELLEPLIKHGTVTAADGSVSHSQGVFLCPSDGGGSGPSYAINAWFEKDLKSTQVVKPTETVIFGEKRGAIPSSHFVWWLPPWPRWPAEIGTPIKPREPAINAIQRGDGYRLESAGLQSLRHGELSNWLYCDGHAKSSRLERVWNNATTENHLWPTRE